MKITVTPVCKHPDGFTGSGEPYVGQHVEIDLTGVRLDGERVIRRDHSRPRREPGHNWLTEESGPWTGFRVDVEPNG